MEISNESKILLLGENARNFYCFKNSDIPEKVKNMLED